MRAVEKASEREESKIDELELEQEELQDALARLIDQANGFNSFPLFIHSVFVPDNAQTTQTTKDI